MCLCRYEGLDRLTRSRLRFPPNSLRFFASTIALDGDVFGANIWNLVLQLPWVLRGDLIPAMAVGAAFGPIIQFIKFRYVPLMYQLLYVNMFCLLDNAFMSWIEQQEMLLGKRTFHICSYF
ncbi:hypothetical protein MKW92_013340 [Papaver armeniacum]|nr:hypothetical protein MKW92_013340 [Papaver armeniacum]